MSVSDLNGASGGLPGMVHLLLRRWRMIAAVALLAVVAAGLMQAVRPRQYTARTLLVLPPRQSSDPRSLGGGAASAAGLFGIPGGDPNARLVNTILRSRTLGDSLRKRFAKDAPARRNVVNNADGSMQVEVRHRDPAVAAGMANSYPELVNRLVLRVGTEATERKEAFLREQITRAREQLDRSQAAVVSLQKRRNAPRPAEQSRGTVDAALQLQQRISEKEVEIGRLRQTVTPSNPQLRAALTELSGWRAQLSQLTRGGGANAVLIPLGESAELEAASQRLLREYVRDEQVYTTLAASLAQAQIDVNNNLPVVSVVDVALPPEDPDGPSTPVLLVLALVLGLAAGTGLVLLIDRLGQMAGAGGSRQAAPSPPAARDALQRTFVG